jgi:phytoene dehydrogenase-like protein
VTAACLDLGVGQVPSPGYVLSLDDPLYVNVQSPPARQAPPGSAVVCALRYGSRSAAEDRPQLEALVSRAGVDRHDIVVHRFLASMTVAATLPRAALGGLSGRPGTGSTGIPGVWVAGDWVGPRGLLADAALASGADAGRRAARAALDAGARP